MNPFELKSLTSSFINNEFCKSHSDVITVLNKYSKEEIASVSLANESEIELALSSSENAFQIMKNWSAGDCYSHLEKFISLIKEHRSALVDIIITEAGKPRSYAEVELERTIQTLTFAMEESRRSHGEVVNLDFANGTGKTGVVKRFAKGPVIGISPFNFPLNLSVHKIGPAFAVGAPVILKPSPYTPLSALYIAKLSALAGYPPGALNVVVATNELSEKLIRDSRTKVFSFTGSPVVGWALKDKAHKKKVVLELGGNAAVIVDEDANLEEASAIIANGAYLYAGQICISTQRIFVHKKREKEFTQMLIANIKNLKVGDPNEKNVTVGPVIDPIHLKRIKEWVEEAIASGAKCEVGGKVLDEQKSLYAPTLLSSVNKEMKVYAQEIFGPVATISSFSQFSEAIDLVNDSEFGLQCGVFTNDFSHVKMAHEKIEVGGIIINNVPGFRMDHMPYGGVKDSGLGREGVRYAMEDFTEARLLVY